MFCIASGVSVLTCIEFFVLIFDFLRLWFYGTKVKTGRPFSNGELVVTVDDTPVRKRSTNESPIFKVQPEEDIPTYTFVIRQDPVDHRFRIIERKVED